MTSFSALQNSRKSQFEKLKQRAEAMQNNQRQADERFWQPQVDKAGNGYAVIRFLPPPEGEEEWVMLISHSFQGPGGWYIENSLTTLNPNAADPMLEYNGELWNSGTDAAKDQARKQKRNKHFISNIYVVNDPANPANNGKVFLFKYGKKIFAKLHEAMNPQFPDEAPLDPFDMADGANFLLKIRKVEGYRNYDKSEFEKPAPLFENEDALLEVWKRVYSLKEFVDPKNFKSYEELKARRDKVLGIGRVPSGVAAPVAAAPMLQTATEATQVADAPKANPAAPPWESDDEDELEFFSKLAKGQ